MNDVRGCPPALAVRTLRQKRRPQALLARDLLGGGRAGRSILVLAASAETVAAAWSPEAGAALAPPPRRAC